MGDSESGDAVLKRHDELYERMHANALYACYKFSHELDRLFWPFGMNPVTCIELNEAHRREESASDGDVVLVDILALGPFQEQCRTRPRCLGRGCTFARHGQRLGMDVFAL